MELGLDGRVAWVLGASSGLGRASAAALAREGARVAISARGSANLDATAQEIGNGCIPVPIDVSDAASIEEGHRAVVDNFGDVEILISNSGGPPPGGFEDHDDASLTAAFELLVASAWRLTQAVLPSMLERNAGVLLYFTSSSTHEPIRGLLLSNMMRPAVVGMMKSLADELGPRGLRALCVTPGRIQTPRVDALDSRRAEMQGITVEEARRQSRDEIPLRRYGDPAEFGDVVAFLASDRASYVTGTSVVVDGGLIGGLLS